MGKRQAIWAGKVHEELRARLGGRCQSCGSSERLELDCILPQGHDHHARGYVHRATFYRRQLNAGNLALLCEACHLDKTKADQYWHSETILGTTRANQDPDDWERWKRDFFRL